jgi:GH25 family lysozyme M1 (1,4-beta-N-acetylmuramidase)
MMLTTVSVPVAADDSEQDKAMGDSYVEYEEDGNSESESGITTFSIPKQPSGSVGKGVDISHWDGNINFKKLAKEVDFVIIRCGYGSNTTKHDDRKFETYVKGCRDNDIPYGVYLYAHAKTVAAGKSEGQHALRQLNKLDGWNTETALPIFYDMEDRDQEKLSASMKAKVAKAFCDVLEDAGYTTGVYANCDWWNNKLTNSYFDTTVKWGAHYNSACKDKTKYEIWQCSETARVNGIPVKTDYNYMFNDDIYISEPKVTGYSGSYDGKSHSIKVKYAEEVLYSLDQETWTTKNPSLKAIGKKTVYYKATNRYGEVFEGSQDIVIKARKIADCDISYTEKRTYTGNQIKPGVTVKYGSKTFVKNTDYTVTYGENTEYGKATITITGIGNMTGTVTKKFSIVTETPKLKTAKKSKSTVTIKWNKVKDASGYQVAFRRSGTSKWYYKTVTGNSTTLKGVYRYRKYNVKVRAYKTVNKVEYYTNYSSIKTTNRG